jgi:hypothetical protein
MQPPDGLKPEVITAKWKTAFESKEEKFGTITLDDEFQLRFPMLDSFGEIPLGTSVLWGITDRLRRCTALTLPFRPPGGITNQPENHQVERLVKTRSYIRYLLIGRKYITDPTSDFVSKIVLTPQPNQDLHIPSVASADTEHDTLLETAIQPLGATVSAWINDGGLSFYLRFQSPRSLQTALEEANILCLFLSFLAHQYVYPTELHVWAADEDEPYKVHYRAFSHASERKHTWVAHTLLLPDRQPVPFSEALQKWYATNEEHLRSRYLYRNSLEEPAIFSPYRFLAIFQALEGIIDKSGYKLLTTDQMDVAKAALRQALPSSPELDTFIRKLNNSQPPQYVLKRELPKVFVKSNVLPSFNVDEFVDRVYSRRNKSSHGGRHLDEKPLEDLLISDTLLLTAIYVIVESCQLGLDAHETLRKFRGSFNLDLPLTIPA